MAGHITIAVELAPEDVELLAVLINDDTPAPERVARVLTTLAVEFGRRGVLTPFSYQRQMLEWVFGAFDHRLERDPSHPRLDRLRGSGP